MIVPQEYAFLYSAFTHQNRFQVFLLKEVLNYFIPKAWISCVCDLLFIFFNTWKLENERVESVMFMGPPLKRSENDRSVSYSIIF